MKKKTTKGTPSPEPKPAKKLATNKEFTLKHPPALRPKGKRAK